MFSKFTQEDIDNMLVTVEDLQKQLEKKRPLSQSELNSIYEDFSIDFTYNSNAIEGNTMTFDETFLLVKQGLTAMSKSADDQVEIVNHYNLFLQLIKEVKIRHLMSESIIKDIHKSLMYSTNPDIAGKYRQIDVGVGSEDDFYYALKYEAVPGLMSEYVKKFNNNKNKSIIDFVDAHIDFEKIHPFVDGNGRTGRMLLNYQLIKAGYLPINVKFADRRDYYNAFKNIKVKNDRVFMYGIVLSLEIESLQNRLKVMG